MEKTNTGTLYGIGVGPGDPDLISVKAVKILNNVSVIFAPFSTKNSYSIAKNIIKSHLKKETPILKLNFPMTKDKEKLNKAWEMNSQKILNYLNSGKDVAFITLGDPLIYSTFGYILLTFKKIAPHINIKIVPGISSYQASAAFIQKPLVKGRECLSVISGTASENSIKSIIQNSDCCIVLKPYKNFKRIVNILKELDLLERSYLVLECGLEKEKVITSLESVNSIPYFSLIIVTS